MDELSGRVVLLTGASSGIGRALATALGRRGARLALVARRQGALEAAAAAIRDAGGDAQVFAADVSQAEACTALVGEVEARLGPVDVLINNAGRADQGLVTSLTPGAIQEMMDLCVHGPLALIQATVPGMRARGRGHVLNVVTHAAFHGFALTPAYTMAKAALHALTLDLAYELMDTPVHVTGVYPGLVDTGFAQAMTPQGGTTAELMAWMRFFRAGLRASPDYRAIEKAQRPEEVAERIVAALETPGELIVFTQDAHQQAAARMLAEPRWWAGAARAFYGELVPPLREMMARFAALQEAARRGDQGPT